MTGLILCLFLLTFSCNKDETSIGPNGIRVSDYLPLKVGAKYKYDYSAFYNYTYENSKKYGVCTWELLSATPGNPVVYQVNQTFNGTYIYEHNIYYWIPDSLKTDTTKISNEISTLSFQVLNDSLVTFTYDLPYWSSSNITFTRLIHSDKRDICITIDYINHVCLRKDVGITGFSAGSYGNHSGSVCYTLIEGPL